MKSFSTTTTCHLGLLATLTVAPHLCAAGLKPVYSSDPATIDTCIDWFNNFDGSTTCEDVRDLFNISPEQFHKWNPSVSLDCEPWLHPLSYCISTSDRPPPSGVTTTTTVASTTSTTSTTTSSSHVPSPTSWEARGCFPDNDPEYPVMETRMNDEGNPSLDIASCENLCWEASINGTVLYAGVKDGNQCWCSSFVAGESVWDESKCDVPCSGDKDEMCGGEGYIDIFNPVTTTAWVSDSGSASQTTAVSGSDSDAENATQTTSSATTIAPSQTDSGARRIRPFF